MKSAVLVTHRNLHFCLNLMETRRQSGESCIIAQRQDHQLNLIQRKKISNQEQRRLRLVTVRLQMVV